MRHARRLRDDASVATDVEEVWEHRVDVAAARAWILAHAVPGLDDVATRPDGATTVRRRVRTGTVPSLLEVEMPARGETVGLRGLGRGAREATDIGRRWLGLDEDPAAGVLALSPDAVLGPRVRARPGVRVPGSPDGLETAVGVVLGQHVSLGAARRFAGRLVATYGEREGGGLLFPSAARLARTDADRLRARVGVTGARARAVVALSRAVADGLDLAPQPDPSRRAAVRAELMAVPGIGAWTADLVALRCLRDPDVFLPGDLVLRRALGGIGAGDAARLAEPWRPHRSLAVVHLWTHHALDPPPAPERG